jgi:osmotically-inducible protein OsmY
MRRAAMLWAAVAVLAFTASCGSQRNPIALDMDLYLHPEGARGDDLLLQTAIQQKMVQDREVGKSLVHVRVVDGLVMLSGKVISEELKKRAGALASETVVRVDDRRIEPALPVRNAIEVLR